MSERTHLLRNVVANYLGPLLNGAVNLVLVTLLVRHLGMLSYGVFVLVTTLLTTIALVDLGLGTAVVKHIAEFRARGDWRGVEQTTRSYLGFATLLGAGVALFFALAARPISIFFQVPATRLEAATIVLRFAGLAFLFLFPQTALNYILQGRQRYDLTNVLTVVVSLARGVLLGGTVLAGGGLVALAAALAGIHFLALGIAVVLYRRAMPEVPLRVGWPERGVLGRLLGFGWATFLADTTTVWIRNLDALLVSRLISVADVSPYAVAAKVPLALTSWVWAGPGATLPWFAELDARDEREKMQRTFLIGMRLLLLVVLPLASLLVALAGPLLAVWVGNAFVPHAILLQIFAVVFLGDSMRGLAVAALYGTGRPRRVFLLCALQFIATLVLIFYCAPLLGLIGVALAVAVPSLLTNWAGLVPSACRALEIRARDFFWQVARSHLLPVVLFWAALYAGARRLPIELGYVLGALIVGGALYVLLYGWLGLSGSERASVVAFARTRWRRLLAAPSAQTPA